MDLSGLSSNWKRLQQRLQDSNGAPPSVLGKRKARADEPKVPKKPTTTNANHPQRSQKSVKKPPIEASANATASKSKTARPTPRTKRMGLFASKAAVTAEDVPPVAPAGDLLQDIPASQLGLVARRPSSSSAASVRSHKDIINSGRIPSVLAGKYVSIDCEMVGVGPDPAKASMLARVSMVNFHGEQVYDSFVAAKEAVTDYRTFVSGITPELLRGARTFEAVQADVAELLEGRILVGHAVRHDLDVLMLGHPKRDLRDTSRHKPYRDIAGGRTPGLKRLARELLGIEIQAGAHSSIEDARATMMLYKREKNAFEREHVRRFGVDRRQTRPQAIDGEVAAGGKGADSSKAKPGSKKKRKKH